MSMAIALALVPVYLYAVKRAALWLKGRCPEGRWKTLLFTERGTKGEF